MDRQRRADLGCQNCGAYIPTEAANLIDDLEHHRAVLLDILSRTPLAAEDKEVVDDIQRQIDE